MTAAPKTTPYSLSAMRRGVTDHGRCENQDLVNRVAPVFDVNGEPVPRDAGSGCLHVRPQPLQNPGSQIGNSR